MKRKLEKHGEIISDANLARRFVSAIEKQGAEKYQKVLTFYRGQMILGNPCSIENLREFLSYVHVENTKESAPPKPVFKGLVAQYEE